MKVASVTELKARLSYYLRWVKRGGEVQVLERGVPVARLVGLRPEPSLDAERRDRLVRAGILRSGSGDASWILGEERVSSLEPLSAALADEREDRV